MRFDNLLGFLEESNYPQTCTAFFHLALTSTRQLSDLAPLLDNTITMATASGVPIMLGLSGVGGMQTMLMHYAGGEGGLLETSLR